MVPYSNQFFKAGALSETSAGLEGEEVHNS